MEGKYVLQDHKACNICSQVYPTIHQTESPKPLWKPAREISMVYAASWEKHLSSDYYSLFLGDDILFIDLRIPESLRRAIVINWYFFVFRRLISACVASKMYDDEVIEFHFLDS
ncbi:hypothetical protein TNCT_492971 [Trichonephila clavata]|uniref:Uncharacterized protein n=1 Tax=Trichonephila clavata TaxID=2740835 RepID=A0A8X6GCL8_TRICU|nr:hypothetical protein TNCT_492971 [Trichonephila clavata]